MFILAVLYLFSVVVFVAEAMFKCGGSEIALLAVSL